ncbi:hypothetical protein D3C75_381480 [compost metagenome]
MIFVRCPGEFDVGVAAGKAFDTRGFTGGGGRRFLRFVFVALLHAAEGFKAENAVHQRAAGIELAAIGVAAVAVFLDGSVCGERAGPFLTDFFGYDVHHAAQRIGAVQRGHRPTHYFDTIDGINRDPVKIEVVMTKDRIARVDALTVNQDQRVAAVESTNADALAVVSFVGELHARNFL